MLWEINHILCGTILAHGLQHKITEVFNEIHRSNMRSLDENEPKPIYREDGKIMKGKNYFFRILKQYWSSDSKAEYYNSIL